MTLTTTFIAEQFNIINNKYFKGELLTPRFEVTHVKGYLGQYHWKYSYDERIFSDSVIRISDKFNRSEKEFTNTIAHEMIHLYIRQNKIKDTRAHHGRVFYSIADRLNKEGGFNISYSDSVEGCGFSDKTNMKKFWVVRFLCGRDNKYFQFVINKKYYDSYIRRIERYPDFYKEGYMFVSTNDKKYAAYRECRQRLCGDYISKMEYDSLGYDDVVKYRFTTLGVKHKVA